ncbi:MAG: hypothetical protein KF680_07455 [Cryobacterium sp.]|nr:hypothetical protein [Cryobacterium sp.]
MSPVNDPQIWTLLGVFAAVMLGGMTLMTTLLMRALTSAIDGVNGRIEGVHGRIDGVDARIDGVHARIDGLAGEMKAGFAAVDAKFETVYVKLEHLDRDVSAISKKVFGVPGD